MGFLDQHSTGKSFRITMLTSGFQVEGTLNVMGLVQTFLNDETKGVFSLTDATMYGLATGNPAASVHVDEVYVRKRECHAVLFNEMLSRDESGLLPRTETLAAYTPSFAIQGAFHMGADSLVSDFFEISRALLLGATDVSIFPLFQPQVALIQHAPLAYISRALIHAHHLV